MFGLLLQVARDEKRAAPGTTITAASVAEGKHVMNGVEVYFIIFFLKQQDTDDVAKTCAVTSYVAYAYSAVRSTKKNTGEHVSWRVSLTEIYEHPIICFMRFQISGFEAYLFYAFGKDSPVIPLGAFVTSCILASGLFSLQQKNRSNQQYFMRGRVIAQVELVT